MSRTAHIVTRIGWLTLPVWLAVGGCGVLRAPDPGEPSAGIPAAGGGIGANSPASGTPAGPASSTAAPEGNPVVLEVNGIEIRLQEYREGLREFLRQQGNGGNATDAEETYRQKLIADLLLYDYARREGLEKEAEFQSRLKQLERQLLVEYLRRRRIGSQITVTDDEIRRYYEKNASEFATPRRVHVRVIQTPTYREAEELRAQLDANPEAFAELARRYPIPLSRGGTGELEPFARGTYAPAFEDVAFNLSVGEISPVVTTEQGHFIIEKLGEIPEAHPSLEEVRGRIEARVRAVKEAEASSRLVESLRQEGRIETRWSP